MLRTRLAPTILCALACAGGEAPPAPAIRAEPDVVQAAPAPPEPPSLEAKYAASWILVAWDGAVDAPQVGRTRASALERAIEARGLVVTGEPFSQVAARYSDDATAQRGGALGVYHTGTMVPVFENAVARIRPGEITEIIETPFGWAFARRDLVREVHVHHLQIGYRGAWGSASTRTREDARALAEKLADEIRLGRPFSQAAIEHSEDPWTGPSGGDLGTISPGQLVPALEMAAFSTEPGAISGPVESPYGWHLLWRAP